MAARFPKSRSHRSIAPQLPAPFRARYAGDTDETEQLWQKLWRNPDKATYDALFLHYAPACMVVVFRLMRAKPERYPRHEFEEMISDACAGLMFALDTNRPGFCRSFWSWCQYKIHRAVYRGMAQRRAGTSHRFQTERVCERIRQQLIRETGQVPNQDEMTAALSGLITNPGFWVEAPQYVSLKSCEATQLAAHGDPVDQPLIDGETIALAGKYLSPEDRSIVERLLKGCAPREIANALGLPRHRIYQRLNGVLWTLRHRADLRAYVDAEQDAKDAAMRRLIKSDHTTSTPAAEAVRKIA